MIDQQSKHYRFFQIELCKELTQKPIGKIPCNWFSRVTGQPNLRLPSKQFDRDSLRAFCRNPDNNNLECYAAVMSWGGQRIRHGAMVKKRSFKYVEPIIKDLRKGGLTRQAAFDRFRDIRLNGYLKGMGAAYYTKLIYFCDPKYDPAVKPKQCGYIFDQWLAKSIEVLLGSRDMKLSKYGYVTDDATSEDYERFCSIVDYISAQTGKNADAVETALFSHGGRTKGDWRQYVIKQHKRLL